MVLVHDMYLFDRKGTCLYYAEWARPQHALKEADDRKMMFGLFFSLKVFATKMDPLSDGKTPMGVAQPTWAGCSFHALRTNTYKLHFLETPSGLKFVLLTEPRAGDLREAMWHLYSDAYVDFVSRNALADLGAPITSELFAAAVAKTVKAIAAIPC